MPTTKKSAARKSSTARKIPMVPGRKASLPVLYGDTPTFLGVDRVRVPDQVAGRQVVFMGVPIEGAVTWGSYSGCELATKIIRHASARYGAFLPERGVDVLDHLHMADGGDVAVIPGDMAASLAQVRAKAGGIYGQGAMPVFFGGDHTYSPDVVAALAEWTDGPVGVIQLDSHLDNAPDFGGDKFARCAPLYRIPRLKGVRAKSVVQLGIRGPRNSPLQMALAQEAGCTVITTHQFRAQGPERTLEQALEIAHRGTRAVYLTICSDILDAAHNPGGAPDFDGLNSHELFNLVHGIAKAGIRGMDFVEIYPFQDTANRSAHLAVWTIVHALAGLVQGARI